MQIVTRICRLTLKAGKEYEVEAFSLFLDLRLVYGLKQRKEDAVRKHVPPPEQV